MGDLNARHDSWNCHTNNTNGITLKQFLDDNNDCALLHTDEHTHFPENNMRPTTIDIAITKNIENTTTLKVTQELNSDHNPIHLKLFNFYTI